jgi:hypothetical protein
MDLYIYYQVREENAQLLQQRVSAMQDKLTQQFGVAGTLKRRLEAKNERHTWMEVYLAVPENFANALEHAAMQAQVTALSDNGRHTEYFLDVPPCA